MLRVRRLSEADDRSKFSCGDPDLDRFFRKYGGQNQFAHHLGVTYVAVASPRPDVLGFATVASGALVRDRMPATLRKRLPSYPLPILRLARLGVAERAQGRGIGKLLLRTVFALAHLQADATGCVGVAVDAKEEAVSFYLPYGFEPLEVVIGSLETHPEPNVLFLELGARPREDRAKTPRHLRPR